MIRISELVKSKGSYHFHRATELKCTFRSVRLECESRNSLDTLLIHKANVSLEICESPLMSFWLIKKSSSCLPKKNTFLTLKNTFYILSTFHTIRLCQLHHNWYLWKRNRFSLHRNGQVETLSRTIGKYQTINPVIVSLKDIFTA